MTELTTAPPDGAGQRPRLLALLTEASCPELALDDWRVVLAQARRCKLSGRLAMLARDRGWMPALPQGVQLHLSNAGKAAQRKRLDTLWEADRLLEALAPLKVPIVLLKGAAYVVADLPASQGREFSDVDILVPRPRLRDAELALFAHGWIAKKLDPYDERYYRDWMHELPPMQHVQRLAHLDVHHTLTPPTSRFAIDMSLVLPACRAVDGLPGLFVLAPRDMVLHSVVHLMQEGDFTGGLRDLTDLRDLVGHFAGDPGFWAGLTERARQLRLVVPLHDALVLAQGLLALPVPDAVIADLAAAAGQGSRRRLVVGLLRRAVLRPLSIQDGMAQRLAAWLLFVRSHWLRMPWYLLGPHLLRKVWWRVQARGRTTPATEALAPMRPR